MLGLRAAGQARLLQRSGVVWREMYEFLGSAELRRVSLFGFPSSVLVRTGDPADAAIARLARDGWFRIFFGRGCVIEIPDGSWWRLAAGQQGGCIVPVISSDTGKLAVASPHGNRSYGLNGRDYAYNLYPTEGPRLRQSAWLLRDHDDELAHFGPRRVVAHHPVPLAAVLLSLTLIKYGIPGEANLGIPQFNWA